MTKDELILVRARLKQGQDIPLAIMGNNLILYTEARDIVHWDDDNEIVSIIRQNTDQQSNTIRPYEMCMCTYTDIQDLRACFNEKNFVACATDAGFSANAIKAAQLKFGAVKPEDFLK